MSREKQINKMCNDVNEIFDEEYSERRLITAYHTAKNLYEKGYRKQSEGEWKQMEFWEGGGTWRCTECGRQVMFLKETPKTQNLNYCPECGAKMSKGENDEQREAD